MGQIIEPGEDVRGEQRLDIPAPPRAGGFLVAEPGTKDLDLENFPKMSDGDMLLFRGDAQTEPFWIGDATLQDRWDETVVRIVMRELGLGD